MSSLIVKNHQLYSLNFYIIPVSMIIHTILIPFLFLNTFFSLFLQIFILLFSLQNVLQMFFSFQPPQPPSLSILFHLILFFSTNFFLYLKCGSKKLALMLEDRNVSLHTILMIFHQQWEITRRQRYKQEIMCSYCIVGSLSRLTSYTRL